jgi:DNA invertase Pin-like site-specific DNA recombinase
MKRVAFYVRVSTMDQNPETQLRELREYAQRRGLSVAQEQEYVDHGIGGTKARRPALDRMLEDARRRRFDTLIVWSCDRLARSTKHFLQVLDELDSCDVQFVSLREAFDTSGAFGSRLSRYCRGARRNGASASYRESTQWDGPRPCRREADRTGEARRQPRAGHPRSSLRHEPDEGRQETRHLAGVGLQAC